MPRHSLPLPVAPLTTSLGKAGGPQAGCGTNVSSPSVFLQYPNTHENLNNLALQLDRNVYRNGCATIPQRQLGTLWARSTVNLRER